MDTIPDWLLQIIPQAGLVILFMWYQERAEIRQGLAREKQDNEWREFMREESKSSRAAIQDNTAIIAAMNNLLITHDLRSTRVSHDVEKIKERMLQLDLLEESSIPEGKR